MRRRLSEISPICFAVAVILVSFAATTSAEIAELYRSDGVELSEAVRIAVDADSNVYVSGHFSDNVLKITPAGDVTEIIGASGDGANDLREPTDVAVDGSGNVYVLGDSSRNVFRVSPTGDIVQIIDPHADGAGDPLSGDLMLSVNPSGTAFVRGSRYSNVFRISPTGTIDKILDGRPGGDGHNTTLFPSAIAADADGSLFVVGFDSDGHRLIEVTPGGDLVDVATWSGGDGETLRGPHTAAIDADGNVYVSGHDSHNAFKVSPDGAISEIIDATGDGGGNPLQGPTGIAVGPGGDVYLAGQLSSNLFRVAPDGAVTELLGDAKGKPLDYPEAVAADQTGAAYVAGARSNDVFRVTVETATCPSEPEVNCSPAAKATLKYDERRPGREKMTMDWRTVADTDFANAPKKGDLRDPVLGDASVALCLYDDAGTLVQQWTIASGGQCTGRPCWKEARTGYTYKDKASANQGLSRVSLDAKGRGRIRVLGQNNESRGQLSLPTGVASALQASTAPTIQLLTSGGVCFDATLPEPQVNDGLRYQSKLK